MLNPAPGKTATSFSNAAQSATTEKKRHSPLTLRLSEHEFRVVRAAAKERGLSVSAYVRAKVFGNSGVRKGTPVKDREALGRLLGLLGQSGIADHLKALAHEAQCGSLLVDEKTQAKIEAACEHVSAIRNDLVAALGLRERPR